MRYYSPFTEIQQFPDEMYREHARPFWNRHQNPTSDTIVICLHGFTATTYESKIVADELFKAGFDTAGLLFPGHGFQNESVAKKEMNRWNYKDLLKVTRDAIQQAREVYRKVYIYGQSMGGAIALIMAEEHLADACAVTAPAIIINSWDKFLTSLLWWTGIHRPEEKDHDYFNESYEFTSVKAAHQVIKLAKLAKKHLSQIQCPLLVCHSKKDDTITPNIVKWIEVHVNSDLEVAWFNKSGHTMPLDIQGEQVIKKIRHYFENL